MHGPLSEQIRAQAERIRDYHEEFWADDSNMGGKAVYGTRLEETVGGAWYSDGTYGLGRVVELRVGRSYDVDEIEDMLRDVLS